MLFLLYFIVTFISNYSMVKYAKEKINSFFAVVLYSLVTCAISTVFFLLMTGFNPTFNKTIIIFALLFSITVLASQYFGVVIYKYMRILDSGLIINGLSLVFTFLAGAILYNEKLTVIAILRMILSLLATVFLVLNDKNEESEKKNSFKGYIICFVLTVIPVFITVLSKEFASLPQKQDENSYFMLVNIFCFAFSAVLILILQKGNIRLIFQKLKEIGKSGYLYISAGAICSNLTSLLTIWLLAGDVAIILFTPLTAAMKIIIQILIAAIAAKEKIPKIPIILSFASALLSFFN